VEEPDFSHLTLGWTSGQLSKPRPWWSSVFSQRLRGRYGSTSEYVRELIRRDQDRQRLRGLLTRGAESNPGPIADDHYFQRLRSRVSTGD
jgi:antitoxin ParD1/3/4